MRAVLLCALALGGCRASKDLGSFPQMPASYEAKELCSCLWVENRTLDECEAWVRQDVVKSKGHTIDEAARIVEAQALGVTARARYLGAREGCVLDPR